MELEITICMICNYYLDETSGQNLNQCLKLVYGVKRPHTLIHGPKGCYCTHNWHHKWHTLLDIVSFGCPAKRWSLYLHTMNPEWPLSVQKPVTWNPCKFSLGMLRYLLNEWKCQYKAWCDWEALHLNNYELHNQQKKELQWQQDIHQLNSLWSINNLFMDWNQRV